ncbi:MAG: C39 family peptidase [Candidatus Andersenbacteria bacterium]|nr:C39 family peptidase [Candidatus Andersenbacteria bacterium]
MRARSKSILIGSIAVIVIAIGAFAWMKRVDIQRSIEQSTLPTAIPYQPSSPSPTPVKQTHTSTPLTPPPADGSTPVPANIPPQANLAVPFTVQAPNANWGEPYQNFCEEASVLMAISYVKNMTIPNPAFADQALLAIKAFEDKRFNDYKDTTIAQTAIIFKEYYKYNNIQILQNPSIQDIKNAIAAKKLVIAPAAGQDLKNPYFQQPGPIYHMLIIKGYTADNKFITNDPGTRHGADFLYSQETIMNAMHDWRADGNIELGGKVVLIVG